MGENAQTRTQAGFPDAHSELVKRVFARWQQETAITDSSDVAETEWLAVNDASSPAYIPSGDYATAVAASRLGSRGAMCVDRSSPYALVTLHAAMSMPPPCKHQ